MNRGGINHHILPETSVHTTTGQTGAAFFERASKIPVVVSVVHELHAWMFNLDRLQHDATIKQVARIVREFDPTCVHKRATIRFANLQRIDGEVGKQRAVNGSNMQTARQRGRDRWNDRRANNRETAICLREERNAANKQRAETQEHCGSRNHDRAAAGHVSETS